MNESLDRQESIFSEALALPAEERTRYLDRACAGDPDLRQRVAELLAAAEAPGGVLDIAPALAPEIVTDRRAPNDQTGERIGRYTLIQKLGEGGAGVVFEAEQQEPVRRRVALKLLKPGMDTEAAITRFTGERQALALMDHPGIARVFDAGSTANGRLFFVMEFVRGVRITEYCDENRLPIAERLKLFVAVCYAVQHAHQKGIIHRDLKPSNILVTVHDGVPVPKVIDFGIAKATQGRLTDETLHTEIDTFIGTPAYASPEQVEGGGADLDTRSDIYSLGALLYELLCSRPPFDPRTLVGSGLDGMRRMIREIDPPRPSSRIFRLSNPPDGRVGPPPSPKTTVAEPGRPLEPARPAILAEAPAAVPMQNGPPELQRRPAGPPDQRPPAEMRAPTAAIAGEETLETARRRGTDPVGLRRQLRGDLDAIVLKSLEKDRDRRYATAQEFALDIERYLNDEPVTARPPSRLYRLGKYARRHKTVLAALAAVFLALTIGLALAVAGYRHAVTAQREAERQRAAAVDALAESNAVTRFLTNTLAAADPNQAGQELTVREVLDQAADTVAKGFAERPLLQARLHESIGEAYFGLGLYNAARRHLEDTARSREQLLGPEHELTLRAKVAAALALAADGRAAQAETTLRESLAIYQQRPDLPRVDVARTWRALATTLYYQYRPQEGLQADAQAVALLEKALGQKDPETIAAKNSLASQYWQAGDFVRARAMRRELLATCDLPREHPTRLDLLFRASLVEDELGQHAEAEAHVREVVEIAGRVLGEDHPQTLLAKMLLAYELARGGHTAEAVELAERAVRRQTAVLGEDSPIAVAGRARLASVLAMAGRRDEAIALGRDALEDARRMFRSGVMVAVWLAPVMNDAGRFAEAEPLCREALAELERLQVRNEYYLSRINLALGAALAGQKRFEEAERILLKNQETLAALDYDVQEQRRLTVDALIALYTQWGKPDRAGEWRRRGAAATL